MRRAQARAAGNVAPDAHVVIRGEGGETGVEGGVRAVVHGAPNRADAATEKTAGSNPGSDAADANAKRRKAEARPSLYQGQRAMTGKQKFRKGTRNPGAWR